MSPHVLVRADINKEQEQEQEQEPLPASLFFFFFCLAFFTLASLLADYLEAYKRKLVKFLLLPFGNLPDQDDGPGDDEQLSRHLAEKDVDCLLAPHQFHYASCSGDNPFAEMSATTFAMDTDKRVLYHAQATLGCNGLRDLFNLGFMRQDTLERRINLATTKINLNSIVSLSAVWLREKIGRAYSSTTMVQPSLKNLCLFLDSKGCSRDMCYQIFREAFQKGDVANAHKVAHRVGTITLTSFRDVVDHLYDHWNQWLLEAQAPKQNTAETVAATGTSGHFPVLKHGQKRKTDGKLPYPAYNHDLIQLSADEYNLRLQAGLEQLHKDQEPHPSHRNSSVSYGNRAPIGHCPPYDIGQASSWGSQPNQSERCVTRLQDCVCKGCHVKGWLSHIPKDVFTASGVGDHDLNAGTLGYPVNKNEKMAMNAQRATLMAKIDRLAKRHRDPFFSETDSEDERTQPQEPLVFGPKPPQVSYPVEREENDANTDLIIFSSSSSVGEVEAAHPSYDASNLLENGSALEVEHDGNRGETSKDSESAFPRDLISFDNDGVGLGEVEHFLADVEVDPQGGEQGSATAPQVGGESYKKERLDEEVAMKVSLLDTSPEKGNVRGLPSGLTADIQIGGIKPVRRDPPYGPVVHDLFYARDNVWVQQAKRPTALEMWDGTESSDPKDTDQS
ncbi:hypothetical protein J3F83DRAFT_710909 [Trichoderma novae-zelandiae]